MEWVSKRQRSLEPEDMEFTLLDYFDVLLDTGEVATSAEKALAAVMQFRPWVAEISQVRVCRAMRGFRKARPARSRYPLSEAVVAAIACALTWLRFPAMARLALLSMM